MKTPRIRNTAGIALIAMSCLVFFSAASGAEEKKESGFKRLWKKEEPKAAEETRPISKPETGIKTPSPPEGTAEGGTPAGDVPMALPPVPEAPRPMMPPQPPRVPSFEAPFFPRAPEIPQPPHLQIPQVPKPPVVPSFSFPEKTQATQNPRTVPGESRPPFPSELQEKKESPQGSQTPGRESSASGSL